MGFLDGLSEGLDQPLDPNEVFDGPETTRGEVFTAAADATFKNDLSVSKEFFLEKATKKRDDLFRSIEGKTIYETTGVKQFETGEARGNTFEQLIPKDRDTQIDAFIRGLKNQDPEKYASLQTSEELLESVKNEANASRAKQQETVRRAPKGFGTTAANFAGAGAASLVDPVNVVAMTLGAPAATSILRGIAINAAASGASEALIQQDIEAWQKELGNEYGIKDKATAVGLATVFGGLLPAAFAGAGKAGGAIKARLPKRSKLLKDASDELRVRGDIDEADALRTMSRDAEIDEANLYKTMDDGFDNLDHDLAAKQIDDAFKADEFPDFNTFRDIDPDALLRKLDEVEAPSNGQRAVFDEAREIAEFAARKGQDIESPLPKASDGPINANNDIIRPLDTRSGVEILDTSVAARNRQFSPEAEVQRASELDDFLKDLDDDVLSEPIDFNGRKITAKNAKAEFEADAKKLDVLKTCALR